ncbi:hypothetical protein HYS72_03450 [Candidatus Pacearchaeota archaeon]|nr:hypothetical protein [Candidatus Pacearchaeota archaeon]MBI2056796.1 hypothetical protein [Candidatus Pacearchaeota archaeon]
MDSVKEFMTLLGTGYFGVAIAGFFFSFGFTMPFAIGAFVTMDPQNIFLSAIVGGFFAMLADLAIFGIIKMSFMDEFRRFEKTKAMKKIISLKPHLGRKIKHYLMYAFAGIVIASPLPDELGVSMLAWLGRIKPLSLAIIAFVANTLGIFVILNL